MVTFSFRQIIWVRAVDKIPVVRLQQSSLPPPGCSLHWAPWYCRFVPCLHKLHLCLLCCTKIFSKSAFRNHLLPAMEKYYSGPGSLRAAIFTLWWLLQLTGSCSHLALIKKMVFFLSSFSFSISHRRPTHRP